MKRRRLRIGLLGCGRLGRIYARSLAGNIAETDLVAIADVDSGTLDDVGDEFGVERRYLDPMGLVSDPDVDACVIVGPTHTHREHVSLAAEAGKPIFCEKPLSISLPEAQAMSEVVAKSGIFFQMGFMRRFDPGYASANSMIEEGRIGQPVLFKSSSRDPRRPSLEYLKPANSGGLFVDMGIHDFDLALWFFGPVKSVQAVGGVLSYPEVAEVGDIDTGIATLTFSDGRLGVVDLSRKGVYGYDIRTEILGTEGAVKVGYLRETPVQLMEENRVSHDTVPYFPERFGESYTIQLRDFALNVLNDKPPTIRIEAGIEALRVAVAARTSQASGKSVEVESVGTEE